MAPLDSGTKTGKLVDRIIKKLDQNEGVVKTNILDSDVMVHPKEYSKYADIWYWTNLPYDDDLIILLGHSTQDIYKNHVHHKSKIIRAAHPASKRSHVAMDEYVDNIATKINHSLGRAL
jgi:hypothetical protein